MFCFPSKSSITVWGPSAWNYLHVLAFNYPLNPSAEERRSMYEFILAFARSIPCTKCRTHFIDLIRPNVQDGPRNTTFDSKDTFSRITVEWHNEVNRRLGKPTRTYECVRKQYETKTCVVSYETVAIVCAVTCLSALALYYASARRSPTAGARRDLTCSHHMRG